MLSVFLALQTVAAQASGTVPFVGCEGVFRPAGGVIGAPRGKPLTINIPAAIAAKLTLYAANWVAVLAPRGWRCIDLETENSAVLYVWPPGTSGDPRAGPIVSVLRTAPLMSYGIDKTYFPKLFEKLDTAKIPAAAARSATDRVTPLGERVFSYFTPAGRAGLGSAGVPNGAPADLPAFGIIAHSFGSPKSLPGIVWLNIRLPPALADARPQITKYLARCLPDENSLDCESGGALIAAGSEFDGD